MHEQCEGRRCAKPVSETERSGVERALRAGRREEMSAKTSCETCSYFVYDEDCEYYVCEMDLDEDEMYRFLSSSMDSCPYYRLDDEYAVVRKQM